MHIGLVAPWVDGGVEVNPQVIACARDEKARGSISVLRVEM
jgi:hypothetical protein